MTVFEKLVVARETFHMSLETAVDELEVIGMCDKKIFTLLIKELLPLSGLTQAELGTSFNIAQSAIARYCTGRGWPAEEDRLPILRFLVATMRQVHEVTADA